MGDVLKRIVHDDGQVIGDPDILAREDGIAVCIGVHLSFSEAQIMETEFTVNERGLVGIETPCMGIAFGNALGGFACWDISADTGVNMFG